MAFWSFRMCNGHCIFFQNHNSPYYWRFSKDGLSLVVVTHKVEKCWIIHKTYSTAFWNHRDIVMWITFRDWFNNSKSYFGGTQVPPIGMTQSSLYLQPLSWSISMVAVEVALYWVRPSSHRAQFCLHWLEVVLQSFRKDYLAALLGDTGERNSYCSLLNRNYSFPSLDIWFQVARLHRENLTSCPSCLEESKHKQNIKRYQILFRVYNINYIDKSMRQNKTIFIRKLKRRWDTC